MLFLFLSFYIRMQFYRNVELKGQLPSATLFPLQIWITLVLMIVFVIPTSIWIDIALYAISATSFFVSLYKWKDQIHDLYIYRKAKVTESDLIPELPGSAWRKSQN